MKGGLALFVVLCGLTVQAQEKIEADRPGETLVTTTVPKKKLQVETGFDYLKESGSEQVWRHPDAVIRYGLSPKVELRMELTAATKQEAGMETKRGILPIQVGLKAKLYESPAKSFSVSGWAQMGLPQLASADHDPGKAFHRIRLLFENQVTRQLSIGYNAGTEWEQDEVQQIWMYSVSPHLFVLPRMEVFLELFGHFRNDHPDHNLNAGFGYFFGKHFQFDLSGSYGLTPHSPHYGLSTGVSYLLH